MYPAAVPVNPDSVQLVLPRATGKGELSQTGSMYLLVCLIAVAGKPAPPFNGRALLLQVEKNRLFPLHRVRLTDGAIKRTMKHKLKSNGIITSSICGGISLTFCNVKFVMTD